MKCMACGELTAMPVEIGGERHVCPDCYSTWERSGFPHLPRKAVRVYMNYRPKPGWMDPDRKKDDD